MNIKKQIQKLYFLDFLGGFNLTDSIWMLLLLSRGFTLWQAGIAEGIFHLVSFLCEIPSGMVADLYGRKRTLLASWIVLGISSVVMLCSNHFVWVCIAFALNAFGYNLQSGTREALTYDSLLQANQEESYLKVSSWQTTLYRIANAACRLMAGVAVTIGYHICYGLRVATVAAAGCVTTTLTEAEPVDFCPTPPLQKKKLLQELPQRLLAQTKSAFSYLRKTPIAFAYMLSSSGISGFIIMTSFILQEHLTANNANTVLALGPLLFVVSLGGVIGPKTALLLAKLRHRNAVLLVGLTGGFFIMVCGLSFPFISAIGGFFIIMCDEALCGLTDKRLNDMFPSAQRATLVSVFSMSFSLAMIVLSPIMGLLSDLWGTSVTFYICGLGLALLTVTSRVVFAMRARKKHCAQ